MKFFCIATAPQEIPERYIREATMPERTAGSGHQAVEGDGRGGALVPASAQNGNKA